MSNPDLQDAKARLLEDIETFSRSKLDLASVDTTTRPRETSSLPTIDPAAVVSRTVAPETPRPTATAWAPPAGGGLLERLRQEAQAKQMTESQRFTLQVQRARMLNGSMQVAFQYLRDLCEQINVLKPAIPVTYNLINLVEMTGMTWQEGSADFRLKPDSSDDRLMEQVTLRFRLEAPREFRIERENPAHEVFRDALFERNIQFKEEEIRNERSQLVGTRFIFPCQIKAGLAFGADYASGELRLQIRNIQRFGALEYRLDPEALTQDALEELAHFVLGEQKRIEKLFRRIA